MRRIEAARDADHHLARARGLEPLREAGDLDVVGLVAILREAGGVGRHEREALDPSHQAEIPRRRIEAEGGAAIGRGADAGAVVEAAGLETLLRDQVEVDVGHRRDRGEGEALAFREPHPGLVDRGLPVPGQVGGRLAQAGGRVDVGAGPAHRGRPRKQRAGLSPAYGDRAAGEVGEHGRPAERRTHPRRVRDPEVLADLDADHEAGHVIGGKQQVGAERRIDAGDADRLADEAEAGGEVSLLVELPIVRQEALRDRPEQPAALDGERAIVDPVAPAQGRADQEQRAEAGGGGDHPLRRGLDRVEQRLLQQQVLDRVGRERQLREYRHRRPGLVAGPREIEHRGGVAIRVGGVAASGAGGDAGEAVPVERAEGLFRLRSGFGQGGPSADHRIRSRTLSRARSPCNRVRLRRLVSTRALSPNRRPVRWRALRHTRRPP